MEANVLDETKNKKTRKYGVRNGKGSAKLLLLLLLLSLLKLLLRHAYNNDSYITQKVFEMANGVLRG